MTLSKHISLSMMILSQNAVRLGLDNSPAALEVRGLTALAESILEPLWERLGPLSISSGYRSPAVNAVAGGATSADGGKPSQHVLGEAADFMRAEPGMTVRELIAVIRLMRLPVDQCIDEFGHWVHVSHALNGVQRGQYFALRIVNGQTVKIPL